MSLILDGTTGIILPTAGTITSVSGINGVGLYNNLIINPEFFINQRAAASPIATANAYNYDRWYYDGTYLYQGVEYLNLRSTTYSISWSGAVTCSYSLNTAASTSQNSQSYTSIANGAQITISDPGPNTLWIRFSAQPAWVKLEEGTSPTAYTYRDYTTELNLCYRYYESMTSYSLAKGAQYDSNTWVFSFLFRQPKRVAPTMGGASYVWPRISAWMAIGTRSAAGDGVTVTASAEL